MADSANKVEAGGTRSLDRRPEVEVRLALEVRSRRLGFAVLRGSHLLDWGVREYGADGESAGIAVRRVCSLVSSYTPYVVIARRSRRVSHPSSKNAAMVLQKIRAELKRMSVGFAVLERRDVRQFFSGLGCKTKYEVACWLAERFAELKWRLPRRRRPWDREDYAVPIFDAIATAVAFSAGPLLPGDEQAR